MPTQNDHTTRPRTESRGCEARKPPSVRLRRKGEPERPSSGANATTARRTPLAYLRAPRSEQEARTMFAELFGGVTAGAPRG